MPRAGFISGPASRCWGRWWEQCGRSGLGPAGPGKLQSPRWVRRAQPLFVDPELWTQEKAPHPFLHLLPGLRPALLPSLVHCGHSQALPPADYPGFSPSCPFPHSPATPLQAHSKWGLHVKISQLFLSLLSTIFIRWSKQSMAEKRENHTALFAKRNRNSNGWAIFNKMSTPVL